MLSISEYQAASKEPAQKRQMLKTGAKPVSSEVFDKFNSAIRLASDVDCFVEFGIDPTATSNSLLLLGGAAEYFIVTPGHRLSVVEVA